MRRTQSLTSGMPKALGFPMGFPVSDTLMNEGVGNQEGGLRESEHLVRRARKLETRAECDGIAVSFARPSGFFLAPCKKS